MPKGPTREWKKLKEPILDDEIRAAVSLGLHLIHAADQHDMEKNSYATLVYDGCTSQAEASEIQKALFRAAKRQGYSLSAKIEKKSFGGYQVRFTPKCKECGKAYVIQKYGEDRSKWPYDPMRKRNENDH